MKKFGPYYFDYRNEEIDENRNPLPLIHGTLASYNDYLRHESRKLRTFFIKNADSLVDRLIIKKNFAVWPYYCLFPRARMYGCRIPWVSALAQGQGISALVRAYSLTEDERYLITAECALRLFSISFRDGGVLSIDEDDGDWWYEEYACAYSSPSGVLNGFILALLGIYDFYQLTGDDFSKQLFSKGISTLCHHIDDFDANCPYKLTYYDRHKHIVTIKYHLFHVKLMEILYQITGMDIFKQYLERWQQYGKDWLGNRVYRWLSSLYYLRSWYDQPDGIRLLIRSISKKHPRALAIWK